MASITELMKELNYPTNEEGVCSGIAHMAERARRSGNYDKFQERMVYLLKLDANQLEPLISAAKKHSVLLREKPSITKPLTKDEEILLTIDAFFFQVWMHQTPSAIQNFLKLDATNLAQAEPHARNHLKADAPKLAQGDAHIAETFMYENGSNDKEISPLKAPKKFFISDTKQPSKLVFLQGFLEKIQSASKKDNLSLGVVISSGNHTIHVFYDQTNNTWKLTNHSNLSSNDSVEQIADQIARIFSRNNVINLSLDVFTDEPAEKVTSLWQELETISNNSLKSIIQNKAVNSADSYGDTPLLLAAIHGLGEVADELLKQPEIDVNQPNAQGVVPLAAASQNGRTHIVKVLLNNSNTNVNHTEKSGISSLQIAVASGHLEIVKELLKHPNIGIKNSYLTMQSPFLIAAKNGYREILIKLINHPQSKEGSLVDLISYQLQLAVRYGHHDIVRLLLEELRKEIVRDYNESLSRIKAELGDEAEREALKKNPIDLFIKRSFRNNTRTLLSIAVDTSDEMMLGTLLEWPDIEVNGLGLERETAFSKTTTLGTTSMTPLILAAYKGNLDILKQLLSHKEIDISLPGNSGLIKGLTPFIAAATQRHLPIIRELMNYENLDINYCSADLETRTALAIAIENGDLDMVQELLKHDKINVNRGNYGNRDYPLHMAIRTGRIDIVAALLNHKGIDLETVNELGQTPLQLATTLNNTQIISMLKQKHQELGIPETKPQMTQVPAALSALSVPTATPQIAPLAQPAALAVRDREEIRPTEPTPPDSIDRATQNEYIMNPIIGFINTTIEKVEKLPFQILDKYVAERQKLYEYQASLQDKVNSGKNIDISDTLAELNNLIQELKTAKLHLPLSRLQLNILKASQEVMANTQVRHEASLNITNQKNQAATQLDSLTFSTKNNYIMEPIINFIKTTCEQLDTNGATPETKMMFQTYLHEVQEYLIKCEHDIADPKVTYEKLSSLVNCVNEKQNPHSFFAQKTPNMSLELNKAIQEAETRSLTISLENNQQIIK